MNPKPTGSWKKGESGNIFGRRPNVNVFRTLCQSYGEEAFRRLLEFIDNETFHEAVRFSALKLLIEQGYGKAPQSLEVKVNERILPSMMTTEQLKLAVAGHTKELVQSFIESGKLDEYVRIDNQGEEQGVVIENLPHAKEEVSDEDRELETEDVKPIRKVAKNCNKVGKRKK